MQNVHLLGECLDYSGLAIVCEETSGLLSLFPNFLNFLLYIFSSLGGEGKQRTSWKTSLTFHGYIVGVFSFVIFIFFSPFSFSPPSLNSIS